MANSLTRREEFNQALCDVRKAHRLIYAYQSKMLDLTYFIKSKLDFSGFGGNKLFSNTIEKKRDAYDRLKIWKDMWAWDFLYSYVFEYYLGNIISEDFQIAMSIIQVSDTGYFDNNNEVNSRIELGTFAEEEKSISKLIFVVEKKHKDNEFAWEDDRVWISKKVYDNNDRMSVNHTRDCLNDKGNIQIIYSIPLDRFVDENSTIETLKEFIEYCNNKGVSELKGSKQTDDKAYSVEKIRETHQRAYAPWTTEDDNKLELLFCEGKKVKELSEIFGRNVGAINSRIKKLELKDKYGKLPHYSSTTKEKNGS